MIEEIEVNKRNLIAFLKDIRKEDKEELISTYTTNYEEKFIQTCLKEAETTHFLADKKRKPLAIGGIVTSKNNAGIIWLLSTNEMDKHKKEVFKYIFEKISLYKKEKDILFNYIYKSNFKALRWLRKLGFKEENIVGEANYKLFYYTKGENFDIRHTTCK